MVPQNILIFIGVILSVICKTCGVCDKTPAEASGPRNKNDAGRYTIDIAGNPKSYTALQRYNITLRLSPDAVPYKSFQNFMLTLEPAEENAAHPVGQLSLERATQTLAKFSSQCPNTIIESNTASKTEIQMYWDAPPEGSGCVAIKATVVESRENWFSEDGPLTKILCEESMANEEIQSPPLRRCCACTEAKYELALEGKWTRNTHPRHFPLDLWNTRLSDVIGASHQYYHAFWRYEDIATAGLEELAKTGETKTLESELKDNSEHIRTIIKARGLQYPNITKTTYAVFRVDSKNHLVSLVSKIIPSPDWIIGISNFELCKPDCTWEESRSFNLYPWDVGTDDGIGYSSSAPVPSHDKRFIRRITPNNPNHPDSPFYDEKGGEIKPIATLYLTRQRLYEKTCDDVNSQEVDCTTTSWFKWSACSSKCGPGIRIRERALVNKEYNCSDVQLVETQTCYGLLKFCHNYFPKNVSTSNEAETVTEAETERSSTVSAQENECEEGDENCEKDPNCPGYFWGSWSICNVTCGKGYKTRFRLEKKNENDENDENESDDYEQRCPYRETVECEGLCKNQEIKTTFGKNINTDSSVVSQGPVGRVVNCKVSNWSAWTQCILDDDKICGQGNKIKTRTIERHPENGGKACAKDLMKFKKCSIPCPEPGECLMSKWTKWTPCSSNCGASAVQIRTRNIIYQPPGATCPTREDRKKCHLPLTCTADGKPIFD